MSKQAEVIEAVFRRYGLQVQRRCLRILGDPEQAADAAQEVFVRLLTKGDTFRGEAEWMTWLYRVATNICLNRIRDSRRRGADWLTRVEQDQTRHANGMEAIATRRQLLLAVLGRFDATTQAIVTYYYLDELDQETIAGLVGLSRVSVNKKLSAFREKAKRYAEEATA